MSILVFLPSQDSSAQSSITAAQHETLTQRVCYENDDTPEPVKPYMEQAWERTKESFLQQADIALREVDRDCLHIITEPVLDHVKRRYGGSTQYDPLPDRIVERDYVDEQRLERQLQADWNGLVATGIGTAERGLEAFEDDVKNELLQGPNKNNILAQVGYRAKKVTGDSLYIHPYSAMVNVDTNNGQIKERIVRNYSWLLTHEIGHFFSWPHPDTWRARVSRRQTDGEHVCPNVMSPDPQPVLSTDHPSKSIPARAKHRFGHYISRVQRGIARLQVRSQGEAYNTVVEDSMSMVSYDFNALQQRWGHYTTTEYLCSEREPEDRLTRTTSAEHSVDETPK